MTERNRVFDDYLKDILGTPFCSWTPVEKPYRVIIHSTGSDFSEKIWNGLVGLVRYESFSPWGKEKGVLVDITEAYKEGRTLFPWHTSYINHHPSRYDWVEVIDEVD